MPQRRARRCSLSAAFASSVTSLRSHCSLLSAIFEPHEINAAAALLDLELHERRTVARTAEALAARRMIGSTVRRAYQIDSGDIEKYAFLPVELHRDMRATVEISVSLAVVAHGECGSRLAEVLDLEANAAPGVDEIRGRADQPLVFSHAPSASTLAKQPSGEQARRPGSSCAPYVTANASTPAARAISRSCDVSPIIRVLARSTESSSISSSSIAGCGFGCVSSAQREPAK